MKKKKAVHELRHAHSELRLEAELSRRRLARMTKAVELLAERVDVLERHAGLTTDEPSGLDARVPVGADRERMLDDLEKLGAQGSA